MRTLERLDNEIWPEALKLYREAFTLDGAKTEAVFMRMFDRKMAYLHVLEDEGGVFAMAVTGPTAQGKLLLIDYLAVKPERQGQGFGAALVRDIARWAMEDKRFEGLLIEVESEPGEETLGRIRFWERCGFVLTDYVHRYIWVPEPYRAMYAELAPDASFPKDGRKLFKFISDFHGKAYRGMPDDQ